MTRSCVLQNGDVIVYGRTSDSDRTINIYRGGKVMRSLRPPCQHEGLNLQPVLIQGNEYLAISCNADECEKIYLMHPQKNEVTSAYKSPDLYPGKMCFNKEAGVLYVGHLVKWAPVAKLDMTDKQFEEIGQRVNSRMEEGFYGIHYTHTGAQSMLLFTCLKTKRIQAVDAETGSLLWKVKSSLYSFKV